MEEISTVHTEHSEAVVDHIYPGGRHESDTNYPTITHIAVQAIHAVWGLIYGRLRLFQPIQSSLIATRTRLRSVQLTVGEEQSERHPTSYCQEPPDIPDPIPPACQLNSTKEARHFLTQRPMNEKFILESSLLLSTQPAQVHRSAGSVVVRTKPDTGGNLYQLLRSFVNVKCSRVTPVWAGTMSLFVLVLFCLAGTSAQAQTPGIINLSLYKHISTQSPAIGDVVTYTVVVANSPGSTTATNVSVKNELPAGGVSYLPASASVIHGSGTYATTGSATATVGTLVVPAIAPGDSAVLVFKATVLEQGVWFNTAEIIAADQTDTNSTPNNHSMTEDDYVSVCFSVPIIYYFGDEYTVMVPSGYDQIVWYRDNIPVSSSAISTSLAEVNNDLSLTIKSPGVYRFVTYRNGCPATNCCDIQVIQGPYSSLGDYVFVDANKNGIQDGGDSPLPGVPVVLLNSSNTAIASTTTSISGLYSFTGLTPGVPYSVSFMTPTGFVSTSAQIGNNDATDSDVNPATGQTRSVTLATGENNLNLDAGFYLPSVPTASLGDYVFVDANKNGIQDGGDSPLPGVTVVLLNGSNTAIASTTTSISGLYSFTGLTPGIPYSVSFVTPTGYMSTSAQIGGNDATDSDVNPATGLTRSVTLATGENNLNLDAGFYLQSTCPTDYSLVVSGDVATCIGGSAVLTASTSVPNAQIKWYLTSSGGVPFATVSSGASVTVSPANTTMYYAEVTTGACTSLRKSVAVVITAIDAPVISASTRNTCPATTVNLKTIQIQNSNPDLTYEWYTSQTRSQATLVTNLTAVGAGQYYVFAKGGSCYSTPAILTVQIVDCNCQNVAGVNVGPGQSVCAGDVVPLKAVLSGSATSVTWSTNGTGTFSNLNSLTTTYTATTSDIATGNVLLTATTNDPDGPGGVCQEATSSVIVRISKRPDAPVNVACDDTLVCQGSSTKLIAFAPGSRINWYDQAGNLLGTTQSGGKLVVTPSGPGAAVYYAEAFTDACVSTRSSVTVTVGSCQADLAVIKTIVTPGPYSIGQKVTYAITVSNNGPITATGVKVSELLPTSLTYVSSTPAGQYSPVTGMWTIGTLTNGSNQNLLVEATIVSGGSIRNTAIVSGLNNNPAKAQNDTSSVNISIVDCVVQAPTIICAITEICKGGTTTITAKGCSGGAVLWSNGQSGETIFVTPSSTTTYTAKCEIARCLSQPSNAIVVIVLDPKTPTITASSDNVCPGTSVTLTASGCAGGTIEWSDKAQTGASIVVTPYSKTTYTAQCRIAGCLSTPAVKTINITTDIPAPTIVCSTSVVCPGEAITLTVENCVGTPVWNSTTATTGSIIVTPTVGNNSYSVYCKNDACVSKSSDVYTINIVAPVIPKVTASADTVCAGGAVVLTAANCNGTVMWNVEGKTGPSITVYPTANISYYAQCKFRTCLSNPSAPVNIAVVSPSAPIVKVSKTLICSGDPVSLTATGCTGTVVWHGTDKVGASITIYPAQSLEYYATCKQGSCESDASNRVRVTVNTSPAPAPTVIASTTTICNGGLVSLTATGCEGGAIQWSDGQTGPVVSVTATPANREFYALCKPASGTTCGSGKSNVVTLNITSIPAPTIICSTSVVCSGESLVLTVENCQGTPYWSSIDSHATSLTVTPSATTTYTVYCQNGTCRSATSPEYTIIVAPVVAPTITVSATAVAPGGTITLSALGCAGEVIWSANDINGNNKGASIVVRPEGTQTYFAQCKFRTCLSPPSVPVVINPGDCAARAGRLLATNATVCGGSSSTVTVAATMNGGLVQPTGYSLAYVLVKGGVIQQTSPTPQFVVSSAAAEYTIHTLVYNANTADQNYLNLANVNLGVTTPADVLALIGTKCASLDVVGAKVTVHNIEPPVLSAGPSLTVCSGGTVSLTATGCANGTVTWSDGTVGATYAKPVFSNLNLTAICTVDGCASKPSAIVQVTLGTPPVPIIVSDKSSICLGEPISLTATGCVGGTYIWSDGKTIGNTLTISPTADVTYRVKCKLGDCEGDQSAAITIKVGAPATPTVSILGGNSSTTVCFGAPVTLVAEGCSPNSYVTWSNNQVGNSITVSLASSATFTAQCCNSNLCKSAPSGVLSVTVLPKVPQPTVKDITNTCPMLTADLAKAVSSNPATAGGMFAYFTDATLSDASKVTDPAHVGSGTFYVVEKTASGCVSLPLMIHVQITTCSEQTPCDAANPATASAGADASVCAAKTYQLSGAMGGAGKTAHWTTSGNGTFDNSFALNAIYTASAEDVLSGKVTLTLSVSTNNAACPVAKDDMLLTIDGIKSIPTIVMVGATKLCYGDSVILRAPAGAAGYKWSDNETTQTIVVKRSGVYSVQLLDGKGCSSVKSDNVTVQVSDPIPTPLVRNLRNTCPEKIVDLTKALSSTTPGSSYIYRICECTTSNIVIRPDSVCEGNYWVVEKNAAGCLSAPAKVVVSVFNCAADTMDTDVQITKLASTAFVKNGAPVTYTITVSNAGPHTAKNIDVRDVLPKGLSLLTPSTADYTVSGGVITKRIDSLKAGQSKQIVFSGRITEKKQAIVNMAEITYLDNKDTNLANNKSSVTVTDTSTRQPSLIGIAKAVLGRPTAVGDSLIRVSYKFVVTNFGEDTLKHIQATDDLAYSFSPNTVTGTKLTLSNSGSSLKLNPAFTGTGSNANLLDTMSRLAPGRSEMFVLDVTVRRNLGDTTKSFNNFASASALNSFTTVSDISVAGGDSDPDNDGDPTNNTSAASFTLGASQPQGPSIGLALAVVRIQQQPDSSYNITYKATIKNFGDVALNGVVLTDSLINAFTAPASYTVVGAPTVGAGSTLVVNTGFNGNSQPNMLTPASSLAVGAQDTVLITVNVKTAGNNGPFYSSATVTAHTPDSSQVVKDISNSGLDPAPAGSVSTTVRFDLPKALLGVAKSVGLPTLVDVGVYDIPYTIGLFNLGTVPLKKVQVVDKLSETFGHGALIVSSQISVTSTGASADSLIINRQYTGQGMITNMLVDSMSTLPVGGKAYLTFIVRVDVKNADSLTFYNTALATALTLDGQVVEDMSTAGTNDDPDNDLDPRNNSQPTPISLNGLASSSYLGLAMSVRDTARQADGSMNVTYQLVLQAFGPDTLTHVSVSDTLLKVFNAQTGSTFSVVNRPVIISTGSTLKLNPDFNGGSDPVLVLGDSTSTLAAGKADTLLMVVNVIADGSTTTFLNSAYGRARAKSGLVTDISTTGLIPDLNGNGNPTDSNEREATVLILPPNYASIFIPEGFSPNGDGVNDLFVVRGTTGLSVSLDVYNRWGNLVYTNASYQNDWDGKPNTGVMLSSDASGVPDGTYYYVINLSDGRKFVRYMTINR